MTYRPLEVLGESCHISTETEKHQVAKRAIRRLREILSDRSKRGQHPKALNAAATIAVALAPSAF
tara:strand:- start:1283 stop:1477 length:195 start_codon:yes stop_codon:yes gene_type:complete